MGFVPAYVFSVVLFKDGRAELRSRDVIDRESDYAGMVEFWDYGKLCLLSQRLGLERLARHYGAGWTDSSTTTITVSSGGRQTTVSEYGGIGPVEFWALENAIEAVKKRIDWKAK